jgi:hypothetical protein
VGIINSRRGEDQQGAQWRGGEKIQTVWGLRAQYLEEEKEGEEEDNCYLVHYFTQILKKALAPGESYAFN